MTLTSGVVTSILDIVENRVRELRSREGLSQGELAEVLTVSRQTVNSIETGKYLPSLPLAFRLAQYFDLRVEEVFIFNDGEETR